MRQLPESLLTWALALAALLGAQLLAQSPGPFDVIDLRMVNPNNTHRITITW